MSSDSPELIGAITGRLQWLAERQRVLAQNVANADTPDFKPKDLAPFDFKSTLQQALVAPTVTQANHILTGGQRAKAGIHIVNAASDEALQSGNRVNLESEMMKISQTGMDYAQMATLLKKWQGMVRLALGRM